MIPAKKWKHYLLCSLIVSLIFSLWITAMGKEISTNTNRSPLKLTGRPWKSLGGRWVFRFWGVKRPIFRSGAFPVSFRECIDKNQTHKQAHIFLIRKAWNFFPHGCYLKKCKKKHSQPPHRLLAEAVAPFELKRDRARPRGAPEPS